VYNKSSYNGRLVHSR